MEAVRMKASERNRRMKGLRERIGKALTMEYKTREELSAEMRACPELTGISAE